MKDDYLLSALESFQVAGPILHFCDKISSKSLIQFDYDHLKTSD